MKIYVNAQAFPRNEEIARISETSPQLILHLMKIFTHPNNPSRNHWEKEIKGFLGKVNKVKNSKSYLPKEDIISAVMDNLPEPLSYYLDEVENKYGYRDVYIEDDDIFNMCRKYVEDVAKSLANKGHIEISEVTESIENLLGGYDLL